MQEPPGQGPGGSSYETTTPSANVSVVWYRTVQSKRRITWLGERYDYENYRDKVRPQLLESIEKEKLHAEERARNKNLKKK